MLNISTPQVSANLAEYNLYLLFEFYLRIQIIQQIILQENGKTTSELKSFPDRLLKHYHKNLYPALINTLLTNLLKSIHA